MNAEEMKAARETRDYWWPMTVNPLMDTTTWEKEEEGWNRYCSIWDCMGKTGMPYYRISGPDAERLLSDCAINKVRGTKPGVVKQLICCNDDGKIVTDSLAMCMAPGVFEISAGVGRFVYLMEKWGGYDVKIEQVAPRTFIQVGGPNSFKVLQELTDYDLSQIRFSHFNVDPIKLAGFDCYMMRITMTGELGFEVQADAKNHDAVYSAIFEAGKKYGIQKISARSHLVQHMEAGIAGTGYSDCTVAACDKNDPYYQYLVKTNNILIILRNLPPYISGSYEPKDWSDFYVSPIDIGLGKRIDFSKDFPGKAALAEEIKAPRRKFVCLEWDSDDVIDVYASFFREGPPHERIDAPHYDFMEMPRDPRLPIEAGKVLVDGREVAFTTSRCYLYSFRRMVSNCLMPMEYTKPGTKVTVIWGDPGHPQKEIRATVASHPYKPDRSRDLPEEAVS